MPVTWDAEGDFTGVVDTLEAVTVLPGGCAAGAVTVDGWRFAERSVDPESHEGAVRLIDTTWQLPLVEGGRIAQPGDRLLDEAGRCAVVREVSRLRGGTRHLCVARRTEIARKNQDRFDQERPVWVDLGQGSEVGGWDRVRLGLVGYWGAESPATAESAERFRVVVSDWPDLQPGDRLRRHRGGSYLVETLLLPESIGDPLVVEVSRVEADSA